MTCLDVPERYQSVEVVCKLCHKPASIQIHHDCDEKAWRAISGLAVHDECFDKWESGRKAKSEAERILMRRRQWSTMCPEEFRKPINFKKRGCDPKLYDRVMSWYPRDGKGLMCWGRSGTCKTRFVYAVLQREFKEGRSIVAMTHTEFRRTISALASENAKALMAYHVQLYRAEILFIDDLGKGKHTPSSEEAFESLLDARTSNGRPCLWTTNEPLDVLGKLLSPDRPDAIVRRFNDFHDVIDFNATTKR